MQKAGLKLCFTKYIFFFTKIVLVYKTCVKLLIIKWIFVSKQLSRVAPVYYTIARPIFFVITLVVY